MVQMIPPYPRDGANASERAVFSALEGIPDRPDWVVVHSLALGRNLANLTGEADFIVVVPGRGILAIEAKSPSYVEYKHGDWYLERTPKPTKDPLRQLEAARRSIRGFLRERDLLDGGEPISRMLWFTSLGRHDFVNGTPGDMQFFEWELAWKDDLAKPAWIIEKVLDEHIAFFGEVDEVDVDAAAMSPERVGLVVGALLADFKATESKEARAQGRGASEVRMLQEQRMALDLVDRNAHIYFDGPAGTGKSYLAVQAAQRFSRGGMRTLVTCWNLLMAEQLHELVGAKAKDVEVLDLNSLMLELVKLPENPSDASHDWFTRELPERALGVLREKPYLGSYEAIVVDEAQDIAGNPLLVQLLFALSGTGRPEGTRLVFAGDEFQQIFRPSGEKVGAFDVLKAGIPDLVHVSVRKNCRMSPLVVDGAQQLLGRDLGFAGHRMSRTVPAGFERVDVGAGTEPDAVARALRDALKEFAPEQIAILSPFGPTHSSIGQFLARSEKSADERWLRKQLTSVGERGRVRWASIFKYKGLDADVVILTDLDDEARAWALERDLDWDDLLYVGLTRAKYRCIVVG